MNKSYNILESSKYYEKGKKQVRVSEILAWG